MSKLKKSEFDPDTTLVDYLNRNDVGFRSYSKEVRERFNNKFCMLRDYSIKKDVIINYADIKCMAIPFFIEDREEIEFKKLIVR